MAALLDKSLRGEYGSKHCIDPICQRSPLDLDRRPSPAVAVVVAAETAIRTHFLDGSTYVRRAQANRLTRCSFRKSTEVKGRRSGHRRLPCRTHDWAEIYRRQPHTLTDATSRDVHNARQSGQPAQGMTSREYREKPEKGRMGQGVAIKDNELASRRRA